jgi:hypothetical protein
MRMRSNRGASVNAYQGRKKQRLKAPPQRLRAVMYQGKVVARMRVLMGLYRLRALRHHRTKETLWVEPRGKQRHASRRQTRRNVDDRCASGHRPLVGCPARASCTTIALPGRPPPVEMADTHGNGSLALRNLGEERSAGALRVVMEQGPQQSLRTFAQLASRTKRWT